MKTIIQSENGCIAAASMTTQLKMVSGADSNTVVIQYMPPGPQKITPFVNGEPMAMAINVTPDYATVFEAANQALLAQARAGTGDEPFTDFNHEDSAASSRPQRYYWGGNDPATGGVLLETKLTASGKSAIEGGDFARFSPQWVFHKKTFEPLGLPVNQGAFVNQAAFKNIGRLPVVSASQASGEWVAGHPTGADRAAIEAQSQTFLATQFSKNAYANPSPAMHGLATLKLRSAADAHDHAADLYDKEANQTRSNEERTKANMHRAEAQKHERRIKGSSAANPDFVEQVQARAAEENISLAQAAHAVGLENPNMAKGYVGSFRGGPDAASATATHPFLQSAQAIAQARGCDIETAKIIAARKDHNQYVDFMRSLQASAQDARMQVGTHGKVQEFDQAIQQLIGQGKSYADAVAIVGYRRPDLAEAYRTAMVR